MRFIAKNSSTDPCLVVGLIQDEDDVNITVNGKLLAWFKAESSQLCIYSPVLKDLKLHLTNISK